MSADPPPADPRSAGSPAVDPRADPPSADPPPPSAGSPAKPPSADLSGDPPSAGSPAADSPAADSPADPSPAAAPAPLVDQPPVARPAPARAPASDPDPDPDPDPRDGADGRPDRAAGPPPVTEPAGPAPGAGSDRRRGGAAGRRPADRAPVLFGDLLAGRLADARPRGDRTTDRWSEQLLGRAPHPPAEPPQPTAATAGRSLGIPRPVDKSVDAVDNPDAGMRWWSAPEPTNPDPDGPHLVDNPRISTSDPAEPLGTPPPPAAPASPRRAATRTTTPADALSPQPTDPATVQRPPADADPRPASDQPADAVGRPRKTGPEPRDSEPRDLAPHPGLPDLGPDPEPGTPGRRGLGTRDLERAGDHGLRSRGSDDDPGPSEPEPDDDQGLTGAEPDDPWADDPGARDADQGDAAPGGPWPALGGDEPESDGDLGRAALDIARAASRRAPVRPGRHRRQRPGAEDRKGGYSGSGPDARDPQPFGAMIKRMVTDRGWEETTASATVLGSWDRIVGAELAARCHPVSLRGGELTLAAESTAWAMQLKGMLPTLMTRIRAELGPDVVTRIRIHGPTAPTWRRGPLRVRGPGPRDTYG